MSRHVRREAYRHVGEEAGGDKGGRNTDDRRWSALH